MNVKNLSINTSYPGEEILQESGTRCVPSDVENEHIIIVMEIHLSFNNITLERFAVKED